jgi:hypothetical protein
VHSSDIHIQISLSVESAPAASAGRDWAEEFGIAMFLTSVTEKPSFVAEIYTFAGRDRAGVGAGVALHMLPASWSVRRLWLKSVLGLILREIGLSGKGILFLAVGLCTCEWWLLLFHNSAWGR